MFKIWIHEIPYLKEMCEFREFTQNIYFCKQDPLFFGNISKSIFPSYMKLHTNKVGFNAHHRMNSFCSTQPANILKRDCLRMPSNGPKRFRRPNVDTPLDFLVLKTLLFRFHILKY